MRRAMDETERRREKQHQYNLDNNITPKGVIRKITDVMDVGTRSSAKKLSLLAEQIAEGLANYQLLTTKEIDQKIEELEKTMYLHAQNLEFEQAAALRDDIAKLRAQQLSS